MIDRSELRRAYRPDENDLIAERLDQARLDPAQASEAAALARLHGHNRGSPNACSRASGGQSRSR